jgi:outer membrane protein assembly factor BamB
MTDLPTHHSFPAPGVHLCGLAWNGTHLWYSDGDTHTLYRLEAQTGQVLTTLRCPDVRTGLAYDGHFLWQVAGHPKRIRIIDPQHGHPQSEIALGTNAESVCGLLVQSESYWTGPEVEAEIEEYSRSTHQLLRQMGPVASGDGMAVVGSQLWYTSYKESALIALDLATGREVKRHRLGGQPTGMCWDGQQFWYNDYTHKYICAVRPEL